MFELSRNLEVVNTRQESIDTAKLLNVSDFICFIARALFLSTVGIDGESLQLRLSRVSRLFEFFFLFDEKKINFRNAKRFLGNSFQLKPIGMLSNFRRQQRV